MQIVLINLLIGLAVGDIAKVSDQAGEGGRKNKKVQAHLSFIKTELSCSFSFLFFLSFFLVNSDVQAIAQSRERTLCRVVDAQVFQEGIQCEQ